MSSWFYVENDNRKGPVSDDDMKQMIASFQIQPDTLVWQDGMADWVNASTQFDFSNSPPNAPPAYGADPASASEERQTGSDGLYLGSPSRSFGEAISVCFNKYVDFKGRASRSEFWYWVLFTIIGTFATVIIDVLFIDPSGTFSPLNLVFSLGTLMPNLAVSVRRMHDINRSGWWILLPIVNLVFYCTKGDHGPNHYG